MAISKVIYGNQTLIDISNDTVTADKLLSGYTAHGSNGEAIQGNYTPTTTTYPVRIYIATAPTKTVYAVGDTIDLTGLVVKAVWSDDSETDVTSSVTTSPARGNTVSITDTSIVITYTWSGAQSGYTVAQSITVNYASNAIFGVEWDGLSGTAFERTDDAVGFPDPVPAISSRNGVIRTGSSIFDNIAPWSQMARVTNPCSVSSFEGVSIPKYYYKWTKTGIKMKLQISMTQFTGSHVSPAHADRGDGYGEKNVVYIGRYSSNNSGKSVSGTKSSAITKKSRADWRWDCWYSNNYGIMYLWDYAMFSTIQMLYLVEYADWNIGKKIGDMASSYSGPQTSKATGGTDDMGYHTGYYNYYDYDPSIQDSGIIQYRYIEGLVCAVCDGMYKKDGYIYAIKNPAQYSDNANGVQIFQDASSHNGYASSFDLCEENGFEYILIPTGQDGSSGTYAATSIQSTGQILSAGCSGDWQFAFLQSTSYKWDYPRSMILPK